MEFTLKNLGRLAFPLTFVTLLLNAIVGYWNVQNLMKNEALVAHTHQVLESLGNMLSTLKDAQIGARGYVISGDREFLEPYERARGKLPMALAEVRRLTADNPKQQQRLDEFADLAKQNMQTWAEVIAAAERDGPEAGREYLLAHRLEQRMTRVRDVTTEMQSAEERLLVGRDEESATSRRSTIVSLVVGAVLGIGLLALAQYMSLQEMNFRSRAAEMLRRANDDLERRVSERTVELALANEGLERSNQELERFASVASHDLQEPLRKIQAFASRLGEKFTDALGEQGHDYIERLQSAAARMRRLIDDLLAYSRISARQQAFQSVDLSTVVREVLDDLEDRLETTGGRVEVGELPTIDADPVQMRQLFQNLLGNSLKFHQPGVAPVVKIAGRVLDYPIMDETTPPAPRQCVIEVADNGIGFDEEYLDRIFEVFQRLHGRTEYEGTGIGLAICRRIVERHQGQLTARSKPGEGATFVIQLPLEQPQEAQV